MKRYLAGGLAAGVTITPTQDEQQGLLHEFTAGTLK